VRREIMEVVNKRKFDSAKELPALPVKEGPEIMEITEEQFKVVLAEMETPVQNQKHLAVQIKLFLDHRIAYEMSNRGILSDHTRRWVESYNTILEKIQKALYGDKSVNLNLHEHRITHGDIAARIRKAKKIEITSGD
jgi:hypothetical protein